MSYAETVRARRPDLALPVRELLERYAHLRYGRADAGAREESIEEFRRAVARLSLPAAAPVNISR